MPVDTYYWQAHRIDCHTTIQDCEVEGPIRSFKIVPPALAFSYSIASRQRYRPGASRNANMSGTMRCNVACRVDVSGNATVRRRGRAVRVKGISLYGSARLAARERGRFGFTSQDWSDAC